MKTISFISIMAITSIFAYLQGGVLGFLAIWAAAALGYAIGKKV